LVQCRTRGEKADAPTHEERKAFDGEGDCLREAEDDGRKRPRGRSEERESAEVGGVGDH